MILHLIKWSIDAGEWVCGPTVFNRELPQVGRVERNIPYGRDRLQRLDVYVPASPSHPATLVFLHGGAWIAGDKFAYERICRSFAAAGFLTVNANYRLWPRHVFPKPSQDVASVVRWAYDHAEEFGGDGSRMFLAGDSAGAHLALSYAAGLGKPELFEATGIDPDSIGADVVRGLLLFYGVYDCERFVGSGRLVSESSARQLLGLVPAKPPGGAGSDGATYRERLRVVSPIRHLTRALPPCFVCDGERDFLYGDSVELVRELERLGVPHRALLFGAREHPEALHAFLNFYRRACSQVAMRDAIAFMRGIEA
jgi:acetyl esterase/lipase